MKGHYPGRLYKVILDGEKYADQDDIQEWDLTAACCIAMFYSQLAEKRRDAMVLPADGSWDSML